MRNFAGLAGLLLLAACGVQTKDTASADLILSGGPILTMEGDSPAYVEAVAIDDGRIIYAGPLDGALRLKGDDTVMKDLAGKALLPGFIDPHSHFIDSLTMASMANVAQPPVGTATNPAEIVALLKTHAASAKPGDLVLGWGYDDTLMPKGTKLDRATLDAAFPDNPVVVVHTSKHGAVLNSAAMAKFGYKDGMTTPPGGVIVRRNGNELDGLVMETAMLPLMAGLPAPTPETEVEAARQGQLIYAAAGITTAQEGATTLAQLEQLRRIAGKGGLFLDIIAYPFLTDIEKIMAAYPVSGWGRYENGLKIGGCKLTLDGSPQGRTAWFTTPYLVDGPNGEKQWKGEPSLPAAQLRPIIKHCYDEGAQVLMHANGDAAIDFLIQSHEDFAGDRTKDRHTVCIHCQFVRPDQLKKLAEYKIIPSFFTLHTLLFADTHRKQRGEAQTNMISPMKSAIALGMRPTNHTDYSVTPIDQMLTVHTAVNRVSRSGWLNGAQERVTPYQALQAITLNAARQYREEASKGSIALNKRADLVILSADPTKVDPATIEDIKVLETLKDGKTIYPVSR